MRVQLLPHDSAEESTRPRPCLGRRTAAGAPRLAPAAPGSLLSGAGVLHPYRQARFRSFTCASLLVIMVANTRPKRTLLIST